MASFACYIRPRRRPALGGRDTGVTVYSNCLDARAPNGSRKVSKGSKEGLAHHAAPLQGRSDRSRQAGVQHAAPLREECARPCRQPADPYGYLTATASEVTIG